MQLAELMYLMPLLQGLEAGAAAVEVVLVEIIIGGVDDDEGTEDSVKVSMRASVTNWPSDVVRTFSGFMQIVYDLTTQHDVVLGTVDIVVDVSC